MVHFLTFEPLKMNFPSGSKSIVKCIIFPPGPTMDKAKPEGLRELGRTTKAPSVPIAYSIARVNSSKSE